MTKSKHPLYRSFSWYFQMELERFDMTQIDEFRFHVARSIEQSSRPLSKREDETKEEDFEDRHDYEANLSHLNDQQVELGRIENLADELSIIALNKKAETATNGIIDWYLPDLPKKDRHNIGTLKDILPFDAKQIDEYAARDELRLLNNAIKHEDGVVSGPLSNAYPDWGDKGAPLEEVRKAYERLAPRVQKFIQAFAAKCREHSKYE